MRSTALTGLKRLFYLLPMPVAFRLRLRRRILSLVDPLLDLSSRRILESYPALERGYELDVPAVVSAEVGELAFEQDGQPLVSIIIPAHNHVEFTLTCLRAIHDTCTGQSFEVIVVDDGSDDSTQALVSGIVEIRYLRNTENIGFVGSCNRGAATAKGKYLVFLNNDTVVQRGWLEELTRTVAEQPRAGLVGSQLINADGSLQEAGGIIWRDGSGWNYGRGRDRRRPEFNYLRSTSYCSGASILVPAEIFRAVGGFDERYAPAYYEDTDLAFQIRERGYRVLYQPLSRAVHYEGVSCGTDLEAGLKQYQVRNRDIFQEKWAAALQDRPAGPEDGDWIDKECRYRVLVIDAATPCPDRDSGSVDAFFLMKLLRAMNVGVTFMPEDLTFRERYTADLQRLGVECLYRPFVSDVEEFLRARGGQYDFVFLTRCHVADEYIDAVRAHCRRARVGFIVVDLHYLRQQREAETHRSDKLARRANTAKAQELGVIRKSDLTIVKSEKERELLDAEVTGCKTFLLPLIMDLPGREPVPFSEREHFLFVGGFAHPPNIDAVLYFVNDIWPLVRTRLPHARVRIVGSEMPEQICELSVDGVDVTGYVEDLAGCINRHRVMIAPLRYGAGIKGKIGRALGYGLPCVATSIAVEGMRLRDREHILVADGDDDFAGRCVELYTDEQLWTAVSRNGAVYFDETYSVATGAERIREMMRELGAQV